MRKVATETRLFIKNSIFFFIVTALCFVGAIGELTVLLSKSQNLADITAVIAGVFYSAVIFAPAENKDKDNLKLLEVRIMEKLSIFISQLFYFALYAFGFRIQFKYRLKEVEGLGCFPLVSKNNGISWQLIQNENGKIKFLDASNESNPLHEKEAEEVIKYYQTTLLMEKDKKRKVTYRDI